MFKYLIYFEDQLIVDSQEKFGEEGIFPMDDMAYEVGEDTIFELVNNPSSEDFDPCNIVEDDRYRVVVEEI